jgi:hypothetical protein
MCPFPGNQHLELRDGQAPVPAQLLGEDHQLTADALASTGGVGLGRRHAGQPVLVLAHDRHVRVLTETGDLIRELTLDPSCNYQPQPKN